jgi:KUP system potassium uptake protein
VRHPQVLAAVSPHHALRFVWEQPHLAFITLGAVFLCLTGAEALYADMGHFGKRPIRLAWFILVMPALMLNYLGQGALVLAQPRAVEARSTCWRRPGRWWAWCWPPPPR